MAWDYLPANWVTGLEMLTTWTTQVDVAEARQAETRRNLVDSPRRTLRARWSGLNRAAATRMVLELQRAAAGARRIPLYQDVAVTTATSSSTTINCPTATRRFYVGGLVCIVLADGTGVEFATIDSFTSSAITLTGALTGSFPAGSLAFPAITTEVATEARLSVLTDHLAEVDVTFVEADTTMQAAGSWSALASYGFTQVSSFAYLLDVEPEWAGGVNMRLRRPGGANIYGRAQRVTTTGPRALWSIDLQFTFENRAQFFAFLQFFDAHRGRSLPFWVECPLSLWEPVAVTTTYLEVAQVGDASDYPAFVESDGSGSPNLLIVKTDGSRVIVPITDTTEPGGGVFRLAASLPSMTLSEIARASLAFFVRFESDTMTETWQTSEVAEVVTSVVELLRWESESSAAGNDGFFSGGVDLLCD